MNYEVFPAESLLGHRIFTSAEIQRARELAVSKFGIPISATAEVAGFHIARVALQILREIKTEKPRVGVICGSGITGAQGFVVARFLASAGVDVEVIASHPCSDVAQNCMQTLLFMDIACVELEDRESIVSLPRPGYYDLLVDALSGVTSCGPLSGVQLETIAWINGHGAKVLSVEIASGLNCDTGEIETAAVKADVTVTYAASKLGQWLLNGPDYTGRLVVVDLGLPPSLLLESDSSGKSEIRQILVPSDALPAFAPRNQNAHKGNFGHVYVLGGSLGRQGSIRMAAEAALRAGAGLCTIATTVEGFSYFQSSLRESMSEGLLSDELTVESLIEHACAHDVLVAGPGLEHKYAQLLFEALPQISKPAVLDASALSGLDLKGLKGNARDFALSRLGEGGPRILTPHPGEAAHLLGCTPAEIQKNRVEAARRLYEATGAQIVLKGAHTLIYGSSGLAICPYGNAGMATAGMGDVLAGILGALLARGLEPETAARVGTLWHALAGDHCAAVLTANSLMAGDVIQALSAVERSLCNLSVK